MKKIKLFSALVSILFTYGNCYAHNASITVRNPLEAEVATIVKKFKGSVSWNILTDELISKNLKNVYIAYDKDDSIVAYLRISFTELGNIHINDLVTLEEHRGKGGARELLNRIKSEYSDRTIELTPTKKSIEFYKKMGFEHLESVNCCIYKPSVSKN